MEVTLLVEEMNADELRQHLAEIEKDLESEDFLDDLQHPVDVIDALIAMVRRALALAVKEPPINETQE